MNRSRAAAVVTWAYVAMFGVPAVPVVVFLRNHGRLPSLWGLFDMYGGPWATRYSRGVLTALLLGYAGVLLPVAASGWLLWRRRRAGIVLNLALMPVEAVFWIGFALPLPWLLGIARVVLTVQAGRSPADPSR